MGYSRLESIRLDKNLSSAGWCHQEIFSISIVWKLIIICGMENDRFWLISPPLHCSHFILTEALRSLCVLPFFYFSFSYEPRLPLLICTLFIFSLALFLTLSHSLSLTQITPITAHSSSPAPPSLPLHTSLQQTHTHTFRAAFQERHLFVSVCVELRLQEAHVYKTHSYLLYYVCVCVTEKKNNRESENHQTCQEQVRLSSHHKLYKKK